MTTDFDAVLRADCKELHHGGRYHKGKGKEFAEAMRDARPKAFMMLFERAEGGRQDLDYDASVPMYVNVLFVIASLHPRVFCKSHSNTLEDFIYVTHCALMRANAAIDLLIALPWRWLAANGAKLVNWSPHSMGDQVLERVEELPLHSRLVRRLGAPQPPHVGHVLEADHGHAARVRRLPQVHL